ncbi:hypothetical protein HK097_000700 [Rhizophlyctis rosea]|uniref:TPR-like protein n=1 Tax=Rhizophlyctis rosea TaxID=64517 RepID=A0AAD5SI10_9FUNG|nr:hypothetical protein HK097_000700 [Rhizophlyctis rosea]
MSPSNDKGKRKFPPRKKATAKAEPEPQTYEECTEEALSLEDKGDRYRDGEKARRFYERACAMYERAAGFKADADVLYNWARLALLLAEFSNPSYSTSEKATLFTSAIAKFRAVADLEPQNADNLFNLSQALRGQAELILDPQEGQPGGEGNAVKLLEEAGRVLDAVFGLQKQESDNSGSTATTHHHHQHADDHGEFGGCGTCASGGNEMNVDAQPAEGGLSNEEEYTTVAEIHAVTTDSLIDTLNTHAQVLSMLSREIAEPESATLFNMALSKLQTAAEYAEKGGPECKTGVEVQMRWAEVLSDRADVLAQNMGIVNRQLFQEAIERLDHALHLQPRNAEALCDKGDVLCSYVEALRHQSAATGMVQGGSSSSSAPTAEVDMNMLYAHAIDAYSAACTIEPSNGPVIVKLADVLLLRLVYIPSLAEKKQFALTAAQNYQRALKLKDPNADTVNVLLHLAKALSYLDNKEEEMKYVIGQMKRAAASEGGAVGDDLDAVVGWREGVTDKAWFQQLVNGM